jgi:PAS domain S-box-containing protein
MTVRIRVLLVADAINNALLIIRELQRSGLDVEFEQVKTGACMKAALEAKTWDLIICYDGLPEFDGAAALALLKQMGLDIPFIMVLERRNEDHAVEVIKAGADEYVFKNNLARLVPAVNRELRLAQERRIRRQTEATTTYLASIVESCDDAIIGKALDGTIVSWNAGAERLYGYTASEMIGRSVSALIPSFRPEELSEILERLARGEQAERFETVRIRKDRSQVEVSLVISPIKDATGRTIGASSVARDITERKQEENERLGLIQDLTAALALTNGQMGHLKEDVTSAA